MVWVESPTNPLLKVVDISAVSAAAKKFNPEILVVVDNTFMSPYFQAGSRFLGEYPLLSLAASFVGSGHRAALNHQVH